MLGLGVDASTQSLTLIVLDGDSAEIVARRSVRFDDDLPHWRTHGGQWPHEDERFGEAPPLLWVEALDRALQELSEEIDLSALRGVSVAGQQHGSVYLNDQAERVLGSLDPQAQACDQLQGVLSRDRAPLWTDSRTAVECREIRERLGGASAAAQLTGSDLYERFTGPQIRWFAKNEPDAWASTEHVALVSSFLTSVLSGCVAAIDWGDAAGTNLLDLRQRRWSKAAVQATEKGLESRLPDVRGPGHCVGTVSSYFVERHGFSADCRVQIGTGDNPAAALGAGLHDAGQAVLSLGTSDTLSILGEELPPIDHGHLFVAPTGHDLALLCFRNGALTREHARERFALDWNGFDEAVRSTPAGCGGHHLLPWTEPEIVPRTTGQGIVFSPGFPTDDAALFCRATLEGQAMAVERHARPMGPLSEVRAVGGASQSSAFLQIVADVLDCPVQPHSTPDGAGLGAALQALRCVAPESQWHQIVTAATAVTESRIEPREPSLYRQVKEESHKLESSALQTRRA